MWKRQRRISLAGSAGRADTCFQKMIDCIKTETKMRSKVLVPLLIVALLPILTSVRRRPVGTPPPPEYPGNELYVALLEAVKAER